MLSDEASVVPVNRLFRRYATLPAEHGAWVLLLSPLLAGLVLGGQFSSASLLLTAAAFTAFLLRQPVTLLVKVFSARRPRRDLAPALFWLGLYSLAGLLCVLGLVWSGYAFVLWLAVPALPVFGWHLWLVSRRAERRQALLEISAASMLALTAPAAFWIGQGQYDPFGWLLWGLFCLQGAGSIVYAYLRLAQRPLKQPPAWKERLQMGTPALLLTGFNLFVSLGLSIGNKLVPPLLPLAFSVQFLESVYGTSRPAVGVKPVAIGLRQLAVSTLFTIVFLLVWR